MVVWDFLNNNSNALMVVITIVYVIATICIFAANKKSAQISNMQFKEMKRQFDEINRPIIEMELCYEHRLWYILRFINHGKLTAENVKINFSKEFIDSLPNDNFKDMIENIGEKECIIGVDQHYDVYIGSNDLRNNLNIKPISGKVSYKCNGIDYNTMIYLDISQYMTIFSSTTDKENLLNTIKTIDKDLKELKKSIDKINSSEGSKNA